MPSAIDSVATLPRRLRSLHDPKRQLPQIAKDAKATRAVSAAVANIRTSQQLYVGDATCSQWRDVLDPLHLVVTSPPYWNLKEYPEREGQLGWTDDYESFLSQIEPVWRTCYDLLVPGGRLVVVVGDVCLSRRQNGGRHTVVPLHAAIQEQCRGIGFDNLAPIIWHKIANMKTEAAGKGACLGKPYEPNGVVKNDIEFILMQRKPGGYRRPSIEDRVLSVIPKELHEAWFRQVWNGPTGASTRKHPAPFPVELAERLVRMFSFVGDTVFDPFVGSGSSLAAAAMHGRNGIGIDVEPAYIKMAANRLSSFLADVETCPI